MTSRLDRLFSLLENCPNASLRAAAVEQLGELVQNSPANLDDVFTRLVPLLRSRSWITRLAAADVIRSIVQHLPAWDPLGSQHALVTDNGIQSVTSSEQREEETAMTMAQQVAEAGFLSLTDLRLDRILAQGARLYSMDARELEKPSGNRRGLAQACLSQSDGANNNTTSSMDALKVQRQELNSRLGLEADNVVSKALASHSHISASDWIAPEDLDDGALGTDHPMYTADVATCVRTAYSSEERGSGKRRPEETNNSQPPSSHTFKEPRLTVSDENSRVPFSGQSNHRNPQPDVNNPRCGEWPLDNFCTLLLGDLWALRWETRHGAASALRELLSDARHTKHCGKRLGMDPNQMQSTHSRYLEDIVVRVLCTLALDQLSDFVSDEVVAPVRETAAQLLGVLSLHLSADQVLSVTQHLVYLVTLDDQKHQQVNEAIWKNSWMMVHGGLLGIKYLLASRKDLHSILIDRVAPCLVTQLISADRIVKVASSNATAAPAATNPSPNEPLGADEDIRAAAASALLPVVGASSFVDESTKHLLIDHVWVLLRDTTTDLSPSTGPLLQLVSALTRINSHNESSIKGTTASTDDSANSVERFAAQMSIATGLLHHTSSGIRQQALSTMECLLNSWHARQAIDADNQDEEEDSLPPALLQLVVDHLFHRLILDSNPVVRAKVTKLLLSVIDRASLYNLAGGCVQRLDLWLCQAMQPIGAPFPPHLLTVSPSMGLRRVAQEQAIRETGDGHMASQQPTSDQMDRTSVAVGTGEQPRDANIASLCIGGSQALHSSPLQLETFVWQTRICAIRVLARLFGRLCHFTPKASTPSNPNVIDNPTSVLRYFLDHLLCQLHLTERLAMQRSITSLVLAAWARLPSPLRRRGSVVSPPSTADPPWAELLRPWDNSHDSPLPTTNRLEEELRELVPQLRGKLGSCLIEVVYYEEILGSFKLMQEDCRELVRSLHAAGHRLPEPMFKFSGVRTIAQCSQLLDHACQLINSANLEPSISAGEAGESAVVSDDAANHLHHVYNRARSTVDQCVTLQLHWGTRVEFSVAAAFASLGWLLPGRLSLLIRPLMDTIRCVRPPSDSANRLVNNPTVLLPPGASAPLQRLGAVCLAQLLHSEWQANVQLSSASTESSALKSNPSKAAGKVVKNLAAALADVDMRCSSPKPVPDADVTSQTPINSPRPETPRSKRSSVESVSTQLLQTESRIDAFWSDAQRRGCSMALMELCRTFIREAGIRHLPLDYLQCGLPTLWQVAWTDPVQRIRSTVGQGSKLLSMDSSLEHYFHAESHGVPQLQLDEDTISGGLLVLLTCIPTLLPHIPQSEAPFSLDELIYLACIASCLPSDRIRQMGARLLATLATERPIPVFNRLTPLLLPCFRPPAMSSISRACQNATVVCHGMMEATAIVVEQLTSSTTMTTPLSENGLTSSRDWDGDPLDEEAAAAADSTERTSTGLPEAVHAFLPFMVLLIPPVLRLLADQDLRIRAAAGKLFSSLLNLSPFEASVPDHPCMSEALRAERLNNRQFLDSLLHPERIPVYNLPVPVKASLRGYQQDGISWLSFLNRYGLNGVLCDDLGLGKTIQTICILAGSHHELKRAQKPTTVTETDSVVTRPISLVICPPTLCSHWFHEVRQFVTDDDLEPVIYAGGPAVRVNLQERVVQYDLVIASYDVVRNDVNFFQSLVWNYIVLDEGHIVKSSKSKIFRALKQLRSQHRLILTGTPIQNHVCDLWSLFDFLMPDFLGSESSFMTKFARPVSSSRDPKASKVDQRAGHLALENLHRLVLPFMLRRLKEDVMADLPPKIIQDYTCEMTQVQLELYDAVTKSVAAPEVDESKTQKTTTTKKKPVRSTRSKTTTVTQSTGNVGSGSPHGFQMLRSLRAVCNHPCLLAKPGHALLAETRRLIEANHGPNTPLNSVHLSGKLLGLCRLLADCGFGTSNFLSSTATSADTVTPSGSQSATTLDDLDQHRSLMSQHRALLFFQTRDMLHLTENTIRLHFPGITYTILDGSVPVSDRHNRVTQFNQDPSIDLMLLTTAVGGLGLSLTGADTVIFVEHDWNPSKDLQAMDRTHRIGQRRTVSVYRLITQDSVEEQIMNLQAFKLHLANTVVTSDNHSLSAMDTAHLFDRFPQSADAVTTSKATTMSSMEEDLQTGYASEFSLEQFLTKLKHSN